MPRRKRPKKHPKLPNGYGQIRYLGEGRRNPYGVHPPATEEYDDGKKKSPPALCYVDDWTVGLIVLTSYHAGTYKKGDEILIAKQLRAAETGQKLLEGLLADYNKAKFSIEPKDEPTFEDVFKRYYLDKFGQEYGHEGSKTSMERSMTAAFKNSSCLHQAPFSDIKRDQIQGVVDAIAEKRSYSSAELIVSLFNQVFKYSLANDLAEKNYAQFVQIKIEDDDEHGVPFSEDDLKTLWANREDDIVEMLLIMCYSGYRISEYKKLEVNLKEKYFLGGLKTKAGKNRIVPIHSAIFPLVEYRIKKYGSLLPMLPRNFRNSMYSVLDNIGIERHTPHDCRHTFSALCERYKVNENDRKRMLGHALDLTNGVYGHRTTEELREEIEKIRVPLL